MKDLNTNSIIACAIIAVIVCSLFNFFVGPGNLAGLIHNTQESFDEGIAVDGTEVISGTGGASFTSGTYSTTLDATGQASFSNDFVQGGGLLEINIGDMANGTTADANYDRQLTAAEICDNSHLLIGYASGTDAQVYLPSGITLGSDCLTEEGMFKDIIIENATSVAGFSLYATGTLTINSASTTESTYASITASEIVTLRLQMASGTASTVEAFMTSFK